jgi:hypothetical protein
MDVLEEWDKHTMPAHDMFVTMHSMKLYSYVSLSVWKIWVIGTVLYSYGSSLKCCL